MDEENKKKLEENFEFLESSNEVVEKWMKIKETLESSKRKGE